MPSKPYPENKCVIPKTYDLRISIILSIIESSPEPVNSAVNIFLKRSNIDMFVGTKIKMAKTNDGVGKRC